MEFTVTNNWRLFYIRLFLSVVVIIIAVGGMAYAFLPERPATYFICVVTGAIVSVCAMRISW
jgi:hypothetical protein